MLSNAQIDHFATFGFVVLRDYLGPSTPCRFVTRSTPLIRDAYAATYDERVIDGISGHYLPMASRLTPTSTSLVCDDPRLIDAAESLLGGPVIPECPEGVLYFAEAGWHNDDGIGVRGVKFATYFDHLDGDNGALRFVPCSHHPDSRPSSLARCVPASAAYEEFPRRRGRYPPGDVIAFDLHTWHASTGGRDRLAWTIVYQAAPRRRAHGRGPSAR